MHRGLALLILTALVVGALFAPVKIPFDLVSVGSVLPAEEWRLTQDQTGALVSIHQDFKTGVIRRSNSWKFEPGDLSAMEVAVRADTFGRVAIGDTLVRMYSSVVLQRILGLENDIKFKESLQTSLITGEKPPIVQEAESRLTFAREALTLREKEFNIAKQLASEGVVAAFDQTRAQNALDLAKIEVQTAEKALAVANTGVKNETADVNATEIKNLHRELDFLRRRNAGYVISAPFAGLVQAVKMPGEVLILQKNSEYVVTVPVRAEQMQEIPDSAQFTFTDAQTQAVYHGKLFARETQTQVLNYRTVGFVKVLIWPNSPADRVSLGMGSRCVIHCGDFSPRAYLQRMMRFTLRK